MNFGNLDDWATDETSEQTGVELDLGAGRKLRIRRAGSRNREFMTAVASIDSSDLGAMKEAVARTVVCDWTGVRDSAGEPIPFSVAACLELFVFAPDVFELVLRFATTRGNYRARELEEEKRSLKRRSGGMRRSVHTARN